MGKVYEPEFREKIARLHLEGHSVISLAKGYGVSRSSVKLWTKQYRDKCCAGEEVEEIAEECTKAKDSIVNWVNQQLDECCASDKECDWVKECQQLRKQLTKLQEENASLKKTLILLAKEID